jgi:hypothetical protein
MLKPVLKPETRAKTSTQSSNAETDFLIIQHTPNMLKLTILTMTHFMKLKCLTMTYSRHVETNVCDSCQAGYAKTHVSHAETIYAPDTFQTH